MKISTATILDSCFFENTERVSCGHRVAYLPDARLVASLDPDGDTDGRSPPPNTAKVDTASARTIDLNGFVWRAT
jgi:hypothetical protein